jgi:hypothetical protein
MPDSSKLKEFKQLYFNPDNTALDSLEIAKKFAEKPKMVPVTKHLSNGYAVTYYVGQTDISVGNFPLALDPHTAEELAKKWDCWLPTGKIVSQIHSAAREQYTNVNPDLLSSSGYTDPITGEYHTAEDVVSDVGKNSAIIEYARRVEDELSKIDAGNKVTVTNGKIIITPTDGNSDLESEDVKVFFKGIPIETKKNEKGEIEVGFAQQGLGASPHRTSRKNPYREYCTLVRLVGNKVDVTTPDGESYSTTYPEAIKNPNTFLAFSDTPVKKLQTYIPRDTESAVLSPPSDKKEPVAAQQDAKKSVVNTIEEMAGEAKKKVTEWAGEAGKATQEAATKAVGWLGNVFSEAEEFELRANSEMQKTQLEKFSLKRKLLDK